MLYFMIYIIPDYLYYEDTLKFVIYDGGLYSETFINTQLKYTEIKNNFKLLEAAP